MDRRLISASAEAGYAQAIEVAGATRLLFLSGQVPVATGGTVPDGIEEQTRLVWTNLLRHLTTAGMSLDHLVKVTVFLSDVAYRNPVNSVSDEILGGRLIAWTTIIAGTVGDGWLLEIEAIAAA